MRHKVSKLPQALQGSGSIALSFSGLVTAFGFFPVLGYNFFLLMHTFILNMEIVRDHFSILGFITGFGSTAAFQAKKDSCVSVFS